MGEHREPQADAEQQGWPGWEIPPHKGPAAWQGEGLARALEVGGPGRCPRGPRPAEWGERAVKALPGRTPTVGALRASVREPEVVGSIGQPAIASANRRGLPRGMRARGRRRGHRGHGPRGPSGKAKFRRWARRGLLVNGDLNKVRDPRNSTAAEKVKVSRIGLQSEGAAKDPLTYPFKSSHQNLLDGLAKKH